MTTELLETKATIFRPGTAPEAVIFQLAAEPSYRNLDRVLRPILNGDLERVRVWHDGQYLDMFVDDLSVLKGLERNTAATQIYRANTLGHVRPAPAPESLPAVCGPAVLFHRRVWF